MAALYREGQTLKQIGDAFGLTRERVRQILKKWHGFDRLAGGRHRLHSAKVARATEVRNQHYLANYGCSFETYKALPAAAKNAFRQQRRNAGTREVGWELTFWQWWTIWQESGHWHERGRGQGYVMCRKGDVGPYAAGNVFIALATQNSSERKGKRSGLPIGVAHVKKGNYEAYRTIRMINGQKLYLGSYPTPELAHAAYLMAGEKARAA